MDSMRHLSTSLPQTSRQRTDPSADLLDDFKQAALSVTTLFKTASSAHKVARAAGYQDALDDLLAFLDRENLGLMDGEGWRVRQWATQNLREETTTSAQPASSSAPPTTAPPPSEDTRARSPALRDEEREASRSSSPELSRKPEPPVAAEEDHLTRVASEPPQLQASHNVQYTPPRGDFTFSSQQSYPSNHERENNASGMDVDATSETPAPLLVSTTTSEPALTTETVRILPRQRGANRHNNHNRRPEARLAAFNFNLGSGAGGKRKLPYSDFFDISGVTDDRKDGNPGGGGGGHSSRGGKRGRHV